MKLLPTVSEFDWIAAGIGERTSDMPFTVSNCIPPVFASYVKIFHAIQEDESIQDRTMTWDEEDKGSAPDRGPQTEAERAGFEAFRNSTLVYGGAHLDATLKRIRWAGLAERLGVRFSPLLSAASFTRRFPGSSWPRYLIGPLEGGLIGSERDALKSVLRSHTSVDRILFRFWLLATTHWDDDKMFEGTLDDVSLFPSEELGVRFTPTHWYPENRSWIVCSDYDLTFSLVGGTESLIQRLLDDSTLECARVAPATRIDTQADCGDLAP